MKLRNKKTGDVIECEEVIITKRVEDAFTNPYTKAYRAFSSIAELNAEWEDYQPTDPLIKDEKIRKAVRAWAEVCDLSYVTYKQASNEFYDPDTRGAFAIRFRLIPVEVYLEDGECYTIAELCGEEEE